MEHTTRVGVFGGSLTALAGLAGYIFVPLLTGYDGSVLVVGIETATDSPVWYHVAVLVVPSALVAAGVTFAFRRDPDRPDWTLLGTLVGVPVGVAFVTYLLAALGFVVFVAVDGFSSGLESSVAVAVTHAVGALVLVPYALLIGAALFAPVAVLVVAGVSAGTGYGFLCAYGLDLLWRATTTSREQRG